MSRLSAAIGVPEGKVFLFEGVPYKIIRNRRYVLHVDGQWHKTKNESQLWRMIAQPEKIEITDLNW